MILNDRHSWLKFGIFFGVLFLLVFVWFGQKWYFNYRQTQSHQVQGQLETLTQNSLDIMGVHVLDAYPEKSDFANPQPIQVKITSDTKFVKTIWYMLTKAELAKTNGVWYPDKLKKEQQEGSITDLSLVQGMLLTIKTLNNSAGDKIITASEIDYVIRIYPE